VSIALLSQRSLSERSLSHRCLSANLPIAARAFRPRLSLFVLGSYTESAGIEIIRKHCAEYITKRDGGIPCDYNDIVLCAGASDGIKVI